MSIESNRRLVLAAFKEHSYFFVAKELGTTILVRHKGLPGNTGFIIVPLSNGFSVRSCDGKLTFALKKIDTVLAQMEHHMPRGG